MIRTLLHRPLVTLAHLSLAIGTLVWVQPLSAQAVSEVGQNQAYMTREELRALLDRLDRSASSTAYSQFLRERIREQADLVRRRLEEGDFRIRDRIVLMVEDQLPLSYTFTVDQSRAITLPTLGAVPLTGVLRSELKQHITEHVSRFLRNPVVQVRSLMRLTILGGVGQPGFYTVAGEALLTEAIMSVGGPSQLAKLGEIRVERGETIILEGRGIRDAIIAGRTLDQLNLQAGDRIVVPQRGTGFVGAEPVVRTLGFVLTLPFALAGLLSIF